VRRCLKRETLTYPRNNNQNLTNLRIAPKIHQIQKTIPTPQTPPPEPIFLPKLQIFFADFLLSRYSIDQRFQILETCGGYQYRHNKNVFISKNKEFSREKMKMNGCERRKSINSQLFGRIKMIS